MKRPDTSNGTDALHGLTPTQWKRFLKRHDMIWEVLPSCWTHGAFVGNGRLGAMIHLDDNTPAAHLNFEIGRSDVYDPRPNPANPADVRHGVLRRMLIGQFHLIPKGQILEGTIRLDLWNAETTGTIRTGLGEIRWRCWASREDEVIAVEWEADGGEAESRFCWQPHPGVHPNRGGEVLPDPNPDGQATVGDGYQAWRQPFKSDGDVVTAWTEILSKKKRILLLSVGYRQSGGSSLSEAVDNVRCAAMHGVEKLTEAHRTWWHQYYPASFLSIPDTRLEGFYYIQLYKIASATRPDAPVLDLCGPWLKKDTSWAATWLNMNAQLSYWMHLTANQLHLGESLIHTIDRNVETLIANAPAEYRADSAFLGNPSGPGLRNNRFTETTAGILRMEVKTGNTLCALPWLLHNYFWQYRYSMDENLLQHLFPLLRRAIMIFLHVLVEGEDGRLHLPDGFSDEYGIASDASQDLALTRWGCRTLLWSANRLGVDDPLIPRWKDVLLRLADYPVDGTGLMIGRDMPLTISHRHFSHLLAVYPFCEFNPTLPGGSELIRRSVEHWLTVPIVRMENELQGWTFGTAAAMMALIGDGDNAWRYLTLVLNDFIQPNTMYTESHLQANPTIETPLAACRSLQEMLLQSWGDVIRIFPAVPQNWPDVVFHQFRTEGAFLVSARRHNHKTQWVRVTSLAGEACRIRLGMCGPVWTDGPEDLRLTFPGDGVAEVNLAKGQSVLFFSGNERPDTTILPLPTRDGEKNAFGLKADYQPGYFHRPV